MQINEEIVDQIRKPILNTDDSSSKHQCIYNSGRFCNKKLASTVCNQSWKKNLYFTLP
jgi:SET domain-containing protein